MIITTTNDIAGTEITKYIELITTNVVIGTNVFSDFAASFTDFFGGYSGSYQRKLDNIYHAAIEALKKKATRMGADAVVGTKIDFSEISGKGKSMLMISVTGMAVKTKNTSTNSQHDSMSGNITHEMLYKAVMHQQIIAKIVDKQLPSEEEWAYLQDNPIDEITEDLFDRYVSVIKKNNINLYPNEQLLQDNFPLYIGQVSPTAAIGVLYAHLNGLSIKFLKENKLFDAKSILQILDEGEIKQAISCLNIDKEIYTADDLRAMQNVLDRLNNLPDTGHIEKVKGVFKESEKYICANGHKNDPQDHFCTTCGQNIKGLDQTDTLTIAKFKQRVEILSRMMKIE